MHCKYGKFTLFQVLIVNFQLLLNFVFLVYVVVHHIVVMPVMDKSLANIVHFLKSLEQTFVNSLSEVSAKMHMSLSPH